MLTNLLIVGAILFALGTIGFLTRRNMIVMFLSVEMMLQGVSLNLVAFSNAWANWNGQIFAIYIVTVAAAEAAIALALVLALYRWRGSLDIGLWQELRESEQPSVVDLPAEQVISAEPPQQWPKLTPAGVRPLVDQEDIEETAHV